jgi:WD40 repeat protein
MFQSALRVVGRTLVYGYSLFLCEFVAAQSMSSTVDADSPKVVSYEAVQPVLRKHCVGCHNDEQPRGDLSLASLDKIAAGSGSGAVVVPGKLDESPLYLVTAHLDNPKMPPNKPRIPQRELQLIANWIQTGLVAELKADSSKLTIPAESMTRSPASVSSTKAPATTPATTPASTDSQGLTELSPLPRRSPMATFATHTNLPLVAFPGLQQVMLWDSRANKFADKAIDTKNHDIHQLHFSPDGKQLLIAAGVAGEFGTVLRWDMSSQKFLTPVGKEQDAIQSIDLSVDGKRLALGTTSRKVQIYSTEDGSLLHSLRKHTDWVTSVAWSPDGLLLASGDRFGSIHVWDASTGSEFTTLRNHIGSVSALVWSADGDTLHSAGADGFVRVWNLHSQTESAHWSANEKGILGMISLTGTTLAKGDNLATYGRDKKVLVWDASGKQQSEITLDDEVIGLKRLIKDQRAMLIASDASGIVRQISIDAGKLALLENIEIPIAPQIASMPIRKPAAPVRSVSKVREPSMDKSSISDSTSVPLIEKTPAPPSGHQANLTSDLEESRRALKSIESAKTQVLESLSQLEESEARLKQLIAIQEARIKQLEWDGRKKKD